MSNTRVCACVHGWSTSCCGKSPVVLQTVPMTWRNWQQSRPECGGSAIQLKKNLLRQGLMCNYLEKSKQKIHAGTIVHILHDVCQDCSYHWWRASLDYEDDSTIWLQKIQPLNNVPRRVRIEQPLNLWPLFMNTRQYDNIIVLLKKPHKYAIHAKYFN